MYKLRDVSKYKVGEFNISKYSGDIRTLSSDVILTLEIILMQFMRKKRLEKYLMKGNIQKLFDIDDKN